MDDIYVTLADRGVATFEEKKSQFIGYAAPCKTEEEALAFLAAIRKKHADARHNVYAYQIKENNIARFSDDGEPQGTAGMPVLDIIKKNDLTDSKKLLQYIKKQCIHVRYIHLLTVSIIYILFLVYLFS